VPGLYNPDAVVRVSTEQPSGQFTAGSADKYDFFYLTPAVRTDAMQEQFYLVEEIMKKQLEVEEFTKFASPEQTCQRVIGRVYNMSTEDSKMREQSLGLFNADYGIEGRLKINLQEVPEYSLLEGEIVVVEGFTDSKKFNVNRIVKPVLPPPMPEKFTAREL
jgi:hypothetical protein